MKTNFFKQLAEFGFNGNFLLNIHQDETGVQTVSVVLKKGDIMGVAGSALPPMLFKAIPEELDDEFFEQLAQPVKQTTGIISNLESYQKELEMAKKNAKRDKDKDKSAKTAPEDKEDDDENEEANNLFAPKEDDKQAKAEKKKLFDEAIERAKSLAKQMKYTEALAQLPDPAEYADKAELIEAKRQEILKGKEVYDKLTEQFND